MTLDFFVPMRTRGSNAREHHIARARRVKGERTTVGAYLRVAADRTVPPRPPLRVTLTRASSGTLDDDNVRAALKGARDEIAKWLGVDDRPDQGVEWCYAQIEVPRATRSKPAAHGVRVQIEPLGVSS